MNNNTVTAPVKTMSSLEIVKIINDLREDSSAELQHKSFLPKVVKVLGKEPAKLFAGQYKAGNGQLQPCYHLPKREAQLMVMSESYKVQAAVYDRMVEMEEKQPQQAQLDLFNADHITISKDDYIDLLKSKNQLLEVALSNQAKPTAKSKPEKRKWFWTQADIDALNGYVNQGLANWKIAELTGRSLSAVSCAIARYVVKGSAA